MRRLLSVTFFSGLLTLLRMGSGFIVAKVIAVYAGPSGLAMLGQLQSIASSLAGIVNAPVSSGIVRYTAEYNEHDKQECTNWWRAGFRWVAIITAFLVPLICLLSFPISTFLFDNNQYYFFLVIMAVLLPFTAIGTLLNSIINGQKRFKKYIGIGMFSVVVTTSLMITCILLGHMRGALFAVSIQNGLIGLIIVACCFKEKWFTRGNFLGTIERKHMKGIFNYMLMAVTTAITLPVALILVRNILIKYVGWDAAGQWQAVWKISETYLAVITIALGTYYLPKLSAIKNTQLLKKEVITTLKIILPLCVFLAVMVFLLRDLIIHILFTRQFYEARELFLIQLCGDVIKIASWLISYPMLARGDIKWYISSEILFCLFFIASSLLFVPYFGVDGANYAYLASYVFYLIFMCFYLRAITNEKIKHES
ncbi:O-antigen translocase [Cronobacter sakazakii]|uniref:O-antigen translocase n=1 Tax=Cronobacter sakazakii TaxID=28141 RepID=UPI003D7B7F4C